MLVIVAELQGIVDMFVLATAEVNITLLDRLQKGHVAILLGVGLDTFIMTVETKSRHIGSVAGRCLKACLSTL